MNLRKATYGHILAETKLQELKDHHGDDIEESDYFKTAESEVKKSKAALRVAQPAHAVHVAKTELRKLKNKKVEKRGRRKRGGSRHAQRFRGFDHLGELEATKNKIKTNKKTLRIAKAEYDALADTPSQRRRRLASRLKKNEKKSRGL